jgi:ADP-ribosylglycohydrolase
MNAKQWLAEFASRLGVDAPTPTEFSKLLDLAAEAAHASERVAAPVACWIAAKAGRDPEEALQIAREVGGDT